MKDFRTRVLAIIMAAAVLLAFAACAPKEIEPDDTAAPAASPDVAFDSFDYKGGAFGMNELRDKKLIMLNFWETWCGPCVGELPDIEKLYEKYKDSGFAVVGVYGSSTDEDVASLAESLGITYPLIRMTSSLDKFQTGYVPTTVFCTGAGMLISAAPYVGSRSLSEWEGIIKAFLDDK